MWKRRFPLMDAATGDGNGGGGGGGGDAGAGDGAGAAAPGAGTGDAGAAALAAGSGAPAAIDTVIPEKYRVSNAEGQFDLDASARKLAEAYGNAEKRIGSGDIPPKSAAEYTATVPDNFKDTFDPATDAGFKAFTEKAHAAGITQKQLDVVMDAYYQMAPGLVAAGNALDEQAATTSLKEVWTTPEAYSENIKHAYNAANVLAQKANVPLDTLLDPKGLGNNPAFIRVLAALGPEFAEDAPVGGQSMGSDLSDDAVNALMRSEAYTNPRHADYEKVSAQVRSHFARKAGKSGAEPVL